MLLKNQYFNKIINHLHSFKPVRSLDFSKEDRISLIQCN